MERDATGGRRGAARALRAAVIPITAMILAGCAAALPRNVLPERLVDQAEPSGLDGVRIWGDAPAAQIRTMVNRELRQRGEAAIARSNTEPVSNMLAISGGADDGAFGAGLLNGWTAAGTRPEFDFVTGVSAGALIALFAFLGARYDQQLKAMFTR